MKKLFRKGDLVKSGEGTVMEVCGYNPGRQVRVTWFDRVRLEVYFGTMPETKLAKAS